MAPWFWYAVVAAILYGAHQIFSRLASEHIGDGLGGFVVEGKAALSILANLGFLWLSGRWDQKFSLAGFNYSAFFHETLSWKHALGIALALTGRSSAG